MPPKKRFSSNRFLAVPPPYLPDILPGPFPLLGIDRVNTDMYAMARSAEVKDPNDPILGFGRHRDSTEKEEGNPLADDWPDTTGCWSLVAPWPEDVTTPLLTTFYISHGRRNHDVETGMAMVPYPFHEMWLDMFQEFCPQMKGKKVSYGDMSFQLAFMNREKKDKFADEIRAWRVRRDRRDKDLPPRPERPFFPDDIDLRTQL